MPCAAPAQPGEVALVLGVGPIRLSVAAIARESGADVMVMDINEQRLDFCRNVLHFKHCLDARNAPLAQLKELTHGDLPTLVFDCTGSRASMMNSFNYIAHGGKLLFIGLFPGDLSFSDPYFHGHEMTIMSSRNATSAHFRQVLGFLEAGRITLPHGSRTAFLRLNWSVFPRWAKPDSGVLKSRRRW